MVRFLADGPDSIAPAAPAKRLIFVAAGNPAELAMPALSTDCLAVAGGKRTLSPARKAFSQRKGAFSSTKLALPISLITIFIEKIVLNWEWNRFRARKSCSTGVGTDFGRENRAQLELGPISGAKIVLNWDAGRALVARIAPI